MHLFLISSTCSSKAFTAACPQLFKFPKNNPAWTCLFLKLKWTKEICPWKSPRIHRILLICTKKYYPISFLLTGFEYAYCQMATLSDKSMKLLKQIDWGKVSLFSLYVPPGLGKNMECKQGKRSHHHFKSSIGVREMRVLLVEEGEINIVCGS